MFSNDLILFCNKLSVRKKLHWDLFNYRDLILEINDIKSQLKITHPRQFVYHVTNNLYNKPTCLCGKDVKWYYHRYLQYCSVRCSTIFTKDKREKTNICLYGVKNYAMSSDFLKKSKQTFMSNYGVTNPSKSNEIQQKKIKTSLKKYGAENFSQKHLSDFTQSVITDKENFKQFCQNKTVGQVSLELGLSFSAPIKIAEKFNLSDIFIKMSRSSYEVRIKSWLEELKIDYIENTKLIINPYQLDFYIPKYKIAIEIGSMYFHCEKSAGKNKKYHQTKWKLCKEKDITLLQFFDDDLSEHSNLIFSKIKRLCNQPLPVVGARKVTIKQNQLSTKEEREFLNKFHLQGFTTTRNIVYSAYYNRNLVGVLTILLKNNNAKIERYCTDVNFSFPGMFSKCLKQFINDYNFKGKILTYSNNNYGSGNLYKTTGFKLVKITSPGYFYTKNYLYKEPRNKYKKHLLKKKFSIPQDILDKNSEWQIMQLLKYDRIWDSGHGVWEKTIQ